MTKSNNQRSIALFLVFLFFAEGLLAKSFIFVKNDPTVLHYITSAILIFLAVLFLLIYKGFYYCLNFTLFFVVGAISWAFIATYFIGDAQNFLALITFSLLVIGCFYAIPAICHLSNVDMPRITYISLLIFSLLSVFLFIFVPDLTTDPDSGRFSGSLISVAVASNVFFYFTVLSTFYFLSQRHLNRKLIYLALILTGFSLLYMTKTRSSLLEAIACVGLLFLGFRLQQAAWKRNWLGPTIALFSMLFLIAALNVGAFNFQNQLDDFRLADQSIDQSRGGNWEFGIERIIEAPLFGEGLLTKQTQGGFSTIDIQSGENYDPLYDPHSLILSFAVQAGVPFAIGMMGLILASIGYFLRTFGWRTALVSPHFVLCAAHTLIMIPAGGDLTSFGNTIDRIYWVLLGWMVVQSHMANRQRGSFIPPRRLGTRPRLPAPAMGINNELGASLPERKRIQPL